MTTPESPSLLLQRAADELERMAEGAERAEWWADWRRGMWGQDLPPQVCGRGKPLLEATHKAHVAEIEWAATLSPAVAAPLVAWLRSIALNMAQAGIGKDWARAVYPPEAGAALDFARLILGLSVEEETTQ